MKMINAISVLFCPLSDVNEITEQAEVNELVDRDRIR
jgi:hypothetical protein